MQNTFTRLIFLITLVCIFSCARKELYLLSDSGHPENTYVKKQNQPMPAPKVHSQEQALPAANVSQAEPEPVLYTASTQSMLVHQAAALPEKMALRDFLTVQPTIKSVTKLVKQQIKEIKAEKATLKKTDRRADTEKPRNKLAIVGFYLGLGAVALLAVIMLNLVGIGYAGILFLLALLAAIGGLVTSKMGLSEIKRNPGMYSGKGQALAGLIISIALLAFAILAIIALISVINNFQ